jgi:flagellar basal body-associated protein FliL
VLLECFWHGLATIEKWNEESRMATTPPSEPKLWVTLLKLVLGAFLLSALVVGVLWYFAKQQEEESSQSTGKPNLPSWGIVSDHPVRNQR